MNLLKQKRPSDKKGGKLKIIIITLASLIIISTLILVLIHNHVKNAYSEHLFTSDYKNPEGFSPDCILILGAGVYDDGRPMPMLLERLKMGLSLYEKGIAPKIVVSGDHGREGYDEVGVMKNWLIENGVSSEDIFMDHAGFSTYESMYRMRDVFMVKQMVVVTQKYHLYRSLYNANTLGISSYGVACDEAVYSGQSYREFREALARVKDFFYCLIDKKPKYLGETIPVSGNGDVTND